MDGCLIEIFYTYVKLLNVKDNLWSAVCGNCLATEIVICRLANCASGAKFFKQKKKKQKKKEIEKGVNTF